MHLVAVNESCGTRAGVCAYTCARWVLGGARWYICGLRRFVQIGSAVAYLLKFLNGTVTARGNATIKNRLVKVRVCAHLLLLILRR